MMVELQTIVCRLGEMKLARSAVPEFGNPCARGDWSLSSVIGCGGVLQ